MPHETRAYALPAPLLSDAEMAQIILIRPRRPNDRLGAEAANHHAPRAHWTVESQYLKRTRYREAQCGPTIVRGASGNDLSTRLGDTMSAPAEFASTVEIRKA
jgi:hypothetical protein